MANPRLKRHQQGIVRCKCGAIRLNKFSSKPKSARVVTLNPSLVSKEHSRNGCSRRRKRVRRG